MMSRFTERAQEALQRAQQIMFARQHKELDVEHIFLALLQQRNSLPVVLITKLGADVQAVTKQLEMALDNRQTFVLSGGITTGYITLRANRVLQGAVEEADRLHDKFISTEHLFLALADTRSNAAGRILEEAGIHREKVYAALLEIRGDSSEHQQETDSYRIINPDTLAGPTGFSHGILATGSRMLFLAGQTATDRDGNIVTVGDVVLQYRQVLDNLKAVVEEAGGKMTDIVKMTIYVQDRDDYKAHLKELGQVHREFFGKYYPATALLEISRFFEDEVLVEVEAIAVLGHAGWPGA